MLISEKYYLRRLASDIYDSGVNLASRGSTYKKRESRKSFLRAVAKTKDDSLAWFLKTAKDLGYNLDDYLTPEVKQEREEWLSQHGRGAPPTSTALVPCTTARSSTGRLMPKAGCATARSCFTAPTTTSPPPRASSAAGSMTIPP